MASPIGYLNRNTRAWSREDEQVFVDYANDDNWLDAIVKRFPSHSVCALKTKMSKLRGELGIKGKRGAREKDQEQLNAEAVVASHQLLVATLAVGRWS